MAATAPSDDDEENLKRQRQSLVAPSGRPLTYQGGRNWEARIISRTLYGAAFGALAGLGVGIYKRQIPLTWLTSMSANFALSTCCFCGFQELTRELRAAEPDDWANCLLGGLASGALLGRIHGGPARALPTAVLFASVGTGINFGAYLLKEYRLRRLLGSIAPDNELGALPSSKKESRLSAWFDFELPEWSPIKKLDEEEAKKRSLDRENQRCRMLENLQTGSFSVKDH